MKKVAEDIWIYKGCTIYLQVHPKLLRYAIYDKLENFLAVSNTLDGCKEKINNKPTN